MSIHQSKAIYSFIPKNACSSMRTSLALANGLIESVPEFDWAKADQYNIVASRAQLAKAEYTFVILRCPYARLASVFLDKFVSQERPARRYAKDLCKDSVPLHDLTFECFVESLKTPAIRDGEHHWRPQTDFLAYERYDDYFCVEKFADAVATLKQRIQLDVVDTRRLTGHSTVLYEKLSGSGFHRMRVSELQSYKRKGFLPDHRHLYTKELRDLVRKLYARDFALYESKIGGDTLLFA
ncbi:MAG: sulfotransferase family 2 domain-containing protein [Solimonas sp.]